MYISIHVYSGPTWRQKIQWVWEGPHPSPQSISEDGKECRNKEKKKSETMSCFPTCSKKKRSGKTRIDFLPSSWERFKTLGSWLIGHSTTDCRPLVEVAAAAKRWCLVTRLHTGCGNHTTVLRNFEARVWVLGGVMTEGWVHFNFSYQNIKVAIKLKERGLCNSVCREPWRSLRLAIHSLLCSVVTGTRVESCRNEHRLMYISIHVYSTRNSFDNFWSGLGPGLTI